MSETASEYIPRDGEFDPLAGANAPLVTPGRNGSENPMVKRGEKKPHKPLIEFYSPSQLKNYVIPPDQCLVGDFHLQRGAPSVLAGPPGCGKSRATLWLGVLGAQGSGNWFGMPVRCRFKTLIVQSENGLTRLHRDFEQIPNLDGLDDWLKISAFPSYRGFEFANPHFRADLKAALRDFGPQLVIVDPWNACVRDSMEKDFLEGFERLREVMAEAPDAACLILHHLRKPRAEDRHKGRNLANLLSGSYVLVSMARSVMVMQPASDDTEDARVVFTPAKNNDGELGARTAWARKAGWFEPVTDFDLEEFDGSGAKREPKVNEGHLREIFEDGGRWLSLKRAAEELQERAEVGRSAAYDALKVKDGRFSNLLTKRDDGLIGLRAAQIADEGEES
jgi:AAA domain